MWADNETTSDLLGFEVHADLILNVVTDESMLPVVIGLFGDWGGGKSSVMRMLESKLTAKEYENVACLYFNGWVFEGYQDAKTALLTSILLQLAKHKKFGAKVQNKALALIKRVKWMEVAKIGLKYVGIPLAAALATGGVGAVPALMATVGHRVLGGGGEGKKSDSDELDVSALIKEAEADVMAIREFREEFEKMLEPTDLASVVVLIDDLDRCLPERIIETLEGIKMFVSVPKTAFVIGADPRIVKHAIATRYVAPQLRDTRTSETERNELVGDYLEKLIQVPYHLPRLSPSEIETYINLLACSKFLEKEDVPAVLNSWRTQRTSNIYKPYRRTDIKETLKDHELPEALEAQLTWSELISPVLTEGLKGNPRQIKRMLNALLLRQRLAYVAKMTIRQEVLAKLMVLEYSQLDRFAELSDWQAFAGGFPLQLKVLEEAANGVDGAEPPGPELKEWSAAPVDRWLRMKPDLRTIDLREYFWLARDRTTSTLAGVTMVPPLVKALSIDLTSGNRGKENQAAKTATQLPEAERKALLEVLIGNMERSPSDDSAANALSMLIDNDVAGADEALFGAARRLDQRLAPSVVFMLRTIATTKPVHLVALKAVLAQLADTDEKSPTAKAARKALAELK